jgi:hypothetical protein
MQVRLTMLFLLSYANFLLSKSRQNFVRNHVCSFSRETKICIVKFAKPFDGCKIEAIKTAPKFYEKTKFALFPVGIAGKDGCAKSFHD